MDGRQRQAVSRYERATQQLNDDQLVDYTWDNLLNTVDIAKRVRGQDETTTTIVARKGKLDKRARRLIAHILAHLVAHPFRYDWELKRTKELTSFIVRLSDLQNIRLHFTVRRKPIAYYARNKAA